jgi:hypothetical protein
MKYVPFGSLPEKRHKASNIRTVKCAAEIRKLSTSTKAVDLLAQNGTIIGNA